MGPGRFHVVHDEAFARDLVKDPDDAGAISVLRSGLCKLETAGAETRTLADPVAAGIELMICLMTDGGDCVLTVATAFNETGNNTVTFADVGDMLVLRSVPTSATTYVWRDTIGDAGPALSTV